MCFPQKLHWAVAAETGKGASGIFAYDCLRLASDVYQPTLALAISKPDLCLSP